MKVERPERAQATSQRDFSRLAYSLNCSQWLGAATACCRRDQSPRMWLDHFEHIAGKVLGYDAWMSVYVEPRSPRDPDSHRLLQELSATLASITGDSGESSFKQDDTLGARAIFVVARDRSGLALGCGGLRPISTNVAELKRMFARPGTRGVGAALLAHLEQQAVAFEYSEIWLETRRVNVRAVTFYQRSGYSEIPNFGKYVGRAEAICLGKVL